MLQQNIILISAGAIFGVLLISNALGVYFSSFLSTEAFLGSVMPLFFIGGYLLSSRIFHELDNPQKGYLFLSLPASTLEKLISGWLISGVFYVIFGWIIALILNVAIYALGEFFFGASIELLGIFNNDLWVNMGVYLITHTLFILGACYFTKHNFLKTLLTLFFIIMVIGIYSGIMGWIIFGDFNQAFTFDDEIDFESHMLFADTIPDIARFFFHYLMAPFFLVVSYFRLKERQI